MASLVIAGIIMAFGQAGDRGSRAISERIVGTAHGGELTTLTTATFVPSPKE
ncbi:MAG: hypothetical protein ABW318_11510 [Vicinamibacterales bacterium]